MPFQVPWPPEQVETLKRLMAEGKGPTEIAAIMGLTRNAIVGKIWRLKLGPVIRVKKPPKPRVRHRGVRKPPSMPKPVPIEATARPISLLELTPFVCHWPLDVDNQVLYCGVECAKGKSYCPEHCARAYHRLPRNTRLPSQTVPY